MKIVEVNHPLVRHKLGKLRDIGTDPVLFRQLASEIAAMLAYEATRDVRVAEVDIITPVSPTPPVVPLLVPLLVMAWSLGVRHGSPLPRLTDVTTFSDLLAELLRREAGRPLVTFYDHATDERVELSVTTYANWVAKAASLLCEEHDLERGDRVRVDLPVHWLGPVFLGAAWTAGLVVVLDGDDPADAVVCGPVMKCPRKVRSGTVICPEAE